MTEIQSDPGSPFGGGGTNNTANTNDSANEEAVLINDDNSDKVGSLWISGFMLGEKTSDLIQLKISSNIDNNWTRFSAGLYHVLAKQSGGNLYSLGSNDYGQCGDKTLMKIKEIKQIDSDCQDVCCGDYHSLILKNYKAYCFGRNNAGQCGTGDRLFPKEPTEVDTDKFFTKITAGAQSSAGITTGDDIYVWGSNQHNLLGLASTKDILIPTKLDDNKWYDICIGVMHSLAIKKSDYSLWGWGSNIKNLGFTEYKTPTLIDNSHEWRRISCGVYHSLALTNEGNLYSFSHYNKHGQLGDGTQEPNKNVSLVNKNNDIKFLEIGASGYFNTAIGYTGVKDPRSYKLFYFGDNTYNLIEGEQQYILTPLEIGYYSRVIQRSHGGVFIIVRKNTETENDGK